jgi:adenosine deaminase CECR1
MEFVVDYYTNPARNRGQKYYLRTTVAPLLDASSSPAASPALTPDVLFQVVREAAWKTFPVALRAQWKPVTDLTPSEKAAWLSGLKLDLPGEGRDEFFEKTWWRLGPIFGDIELAPELLVENMKAFGREGVRYLEMQTAPTGYSDRDGRSVPAEDVYRIFRDRLAQPDALATGVTVRFQIVIIRFLPRAEDAVRAAFAFIDGHRDLFVGVNMAGREDNGKGQAARFTNVFREMQRKFPRIPLAIHAGESDEANTNIRDTLLLGADRIGHGVNLLRDPATYLLLRNNRYLVEVNLVSNRLLDYVPDAAQHPFPVLLRTGVPVCLNTDDRGMWDSTFTDEYFTAVKHYNLSWAETVSLARNSLIYAFLEDTTKARLVADYEKAIAAYEARYLTAEWRTTAATVSPVVSNYGKKTFGLTSPANLGELR